MSKFRDLSRGTTIVEKLFFLPFVVWILMLQACSDPSGSEPVNIADLELFNQQVRARQQPELEDLPNFRTVESFEYGASSIGSPFSEQNVVPIRQPSLEIDPVLPDQGRLRQALEQFSIDLLKMVGTIKRDTQLNAIVIAPDDTVHRVTIGDYMGTNLGEIIQVSEGEIVLEETIRTQKGHWEKREVSLALSD